MKIRFFPTEYTAIRCGHRTRRSRHVKLFGRLVYISLPFNKSGTVDWCIDCVIERMTLQCPWCKAPLFPGTLVTFDAPLGAYTVNTRVITNEDLIPAGCMGCAPKGIHPDGILMPDENGMGVHFEPL